MLRIHSATDRLIKIQMIILWIKQLFSKVMEKLIMEAVELGLGNLWNLPFQKDHQKMFNQLKNDSQVLNQAQMLKVRQNSKEAFDQELCIQTLLLIKHREDDRIYRI